MLSFFTVQMLARQDILFPSFEGENKKKKEVISEKGVMCSFPVWPFHWTDRISVLPQCRTSIAIPGFLSCLSTYGHTIVQGEWSMWTHRLVWCKSSTGYGTGKAKCGSNGSRMQPWRAWMRIMRRSLIQIAQREGGFGLGLGKSSGKEHLRGREIKGISRRREGDSRVSRKLTGSGEGSTRKRWEGT